LGVVGCAEPFEETRQNLTSFRIAALGVYDGTAVAALWSGEGLFHSAAPALSWTLNDQPIGSGWQVAVNGYGTLGLTAMSPSGVVRQAQLSVSEAPLDRLSLSREAVMLPKSLTLTERREVSGTAVETTVEEGHGVRLVVGSRQAGESLRWMLGGGIGTLLELNEDSADVLREEVSFEDGLVVDRQDLGPGMVHALVLAIDGSGANRWLWADGAVSVDGSLARHEGRLVALDGALSPGLLAVTLLEQVDQAGLSFGDSVVVEDLSEQEPLDCASASEPFRLAWVAEGRCVLSEVLGARVVVETW
jgi:hypothetical protein